MNKITAHEIVSIRKALKLSKRELADLCGVGAATVSRWEGAGAGALNIKKSALDVLLQLRRGKSAGAALFQAPAVSAFPISGRAPKVRFHNSFLQAFAALRRRLK